MPKQPEAVNACSQRGPKGDNHEGLMRVTKGKTDDKHKTINVAASCDAAKGPVKGTEEVNGLTIPFIR
jgi:hypothetical protein